MVRLLPAIYRYLLYYYRQYHCTAEVKYARVVATGMYDEDRYSSSAGPIYLAFT